MLRKASSHEPEARMAADTKPASARREERSILPRHDDRVRTRAGSAAGSSTLTASPGARQGRAPRRSLAPTPQRVAPKSNYAAVCPLRAWGASKRPVESKNRRAVGAGGTDARPRRIARTVACRNGTPPHRFVLAEPVMHQSSGRAARRTVGRVVRSEHLNQSRTSSGKRHGPPGLGKGHSPGKHRHDGRLAGHAGTRS